MITRHTVETLINKCKTLELSVRKELLEVNSSTHVDNARRRILYSDLELLRLDIYEAVLESEGGDDKIVEETYNSIDEVLKLLKLVPIQKKTTIWSHLEVVLRFIAVSCSFMLVGSMCSLPLLFIRAVDQFLQVDAFEYWSEAFKRRIAWFFLYQSGIDADVEGLDRRYFKASCVLMTFTHASNLDGFLVSGTCPIRQLAFGKKELFVVPFFSWISLAFGGVPVDRNNRDRAVKALKRSTDAAKNEKLCIAIAPEGTRSLTGHLLPFKKGTFYMWEEMQAPIVPFVIFGAYDLYPVGSWVNSTGRVTVRYLPPLYPSEARDRDRMMRLVRRRMLESLRQCPPTMAQEISPAFYAASLLSNVAVILLSLLLCGAAYQTLAVRLQYSLSQIALGGTGVVVGITAALYIYYVYIVDSGTAADKPQKGEMTKKDQ